VIVGVATGLGAEAVGLGVDWAPISAGTAQTDPSIAHAAIHGRRLEHARDARWQSPVWSFAPTLLDRAIDQLPCSQMSPPHLSWNWVFLYQTAQTLMVDARTLPIRACFVVQLVAKCSYLAPGTLGRRLMLDPLATDDADGVSESGRDFEQGTIQLCAAAKFVHEFPELQSAATIAAVTLPTGSNVGDAAILTLRTPFLPVIRKRHKKGYTHGAHLRAVELLHP
jgi:hypothetical protein